MKNLAPITVGSYIFEVSANHFGENILEVTVKCGEYTMTRKMMCGCPHDHPESQFEKDVNDFAMRLAKELSGRIRAEELAKKFAQS